MLELINWRLPTYDYGTSKSVRTSGSEWTFHYSLFLPSISSQSRPAFPKLFTVSAPPPPIPPTHTHKSQKKRHCSSCFPFPRGNSF